MNYKQKFYCSECGSDQVRWDALAEWDCEIQDHVLCATYDHTDCLFCEGECRTVETVGAEVYIKEGYVALENNKIRDFTDIYGSAHLPILYGDPSKLYADGTIAYCYMINLMCLVVDCTKTTPIMVYEVEEKEYHYPTKNKT